MNIRPEGLFDPSTCICDLFVCGISKVGTMERELVTIPVRNRAPANYECLHCGYGSVNNTAFGLSSSRPASFVLLTAEPIGSGFDLCYWHRMVLVFELDQRNNLSLVAGRVIWLGVSTHRLPSQRLVLQTSQNPLSFYFSCLVSFHYFGQLIRSHSA